MLTFKDAIYRHSMVSDLVKNTWKNRPKYIEALEGAWMGSTSSLDNGSYMASAARLAIPLDYIPLFRSNDSIPVAFFLGCVSATMISNATDETDLSDMTACSEIIASAIELFEIRRKQADNIQEGFGADRSAAWLILRKCVDASPKIEKKMLEIARLAGRMFEKMKYSGMPKPTNDPLFVTGVDTGDNIDRIMDEEAALLGVDGANAEVLSRLEDRQVLEYQMSGETQHGRGPLVITIDESGSMHEDRQIWSKACAVALSRVASGEGRLVRIIHFSTATQIHDLDASDPESLRQLAWNHLGGGTDIETAMRVAVDQCADLEKNGVAGADIVMITDGEDSYTEEPFIKMKQLGVQLWTISIDVDLSRAKKYLSTYATQYLHVTDRNMGSDAKLEEMSTLKDAAMNNDNRRSDLN